MRMRIISCHYVAVSCEREIMVMPKKRKSTVWEFFDEPVVIGEHDENDGKVVKKVPCKICGTNLADGGGTTNLMNHLKMKHSEQ